MFAMFYNPPSKKEKLNYANIAILQGAMGLSTAVIGLLVLSPVLAPTVSAGVTIILLMIISLAVMSGISCATGILNRQDALKM